MTRKQLDRALIKLFKEDREIVPRVAFPSSLYSYVWALWSRTKQGRRSVGGKP